MLRIPTFLRFLCFLLVGCPMTPPLPRNMSLTAFDPHRQVFECRHEVDLVPPIDVEAEALTQEALRLTSRSFGPNERDYRQAAQLWPQAAARNHWQAMMNLASLLATGGGEEERLRV